MIVLLIVSVAIGLAAVAWYAVLCVRYALCVDYAKEHYKWQEIPSAEVLQSAYEQLGDWKFDHQIVRFGKSKIDICFPTYATVSRKNGWQRNILILPSLREYRKFMRWEKNWKLEQEMRATEKNKRGNRSNDALLDMSERLEQKSLSDNGAADSLKVRDKIRDILGDPGADGPDSGEGARKEIAE